MSRKSPCAIIRSWLAVSVIALIVGGLYVLLSSSQRSSAAPALPTINPNLPPVKQTLEYVEQQRYLIALQTPAATKDPHSQPPPGTPEALPVGIFDDGNPILPHVYVLRNSWAGLVGNDYVIVYAGAYRSDLEQGVLLVRREATVSGGTHSMNEYITPTKEGALKIAAADGTRLTVTTANKTILTFNPIAPLNPGFVTPTPRTPTPAP